jgi:hypothetical protein
MEYDLEDVESRLSFKAFQAVTMPRDGPSASREMMF